MARRNSGSVGLGGGAFRGRFFPPPCGLEPQVLEVGERDAGHERVSVQAGPGSPLEVVAPEFLLELLVRLLADPTSLDRRGQMSQRGAGREIAEIVLRSPLRRHSPMSQASSPGRWPWRGLRGPAATRPRTAAKRAA